MSNLSRCDELIDGAPNFTAEEKQKIRDYQVPDLMTPRLPWYRRRKGQTGAQLAEARRQWEAAWREKLWNLERDA
jgi:hypothetical protein